ncbi:MAG: hypothetical protein IIZ12_00360, partial [Eggerthellaceae bacterium]|nr:hypothetical protein [Eggerthellaceae bacterium]
DADGVPIQIGDVLELPGMDDYYPSEVVRLIYDGFEDEWFFDGEVLGSFTGQVGHYDTAGWVHYVKPRTLEDVLVDMLEDAVGYSDAHTDVSLVAVEKYADEIRELLGGDAE